MAPRRHRPHSSSAPQPATSPKLAQFTRREKLLLAAGIWLAYAAIGTWGQFNFGDLMGYYNLLTDAFLAGRLHVLPTSTLQDLIPYQDRYYFQWGPFPALLHAAARLFGATLSDRVACLLAGWLSALVFFEILIALRRLWFPWSPQGALRVVRSGVRLRHTGGATGLVRIGLPREHRLCGLAAPGSLVVFPLLP